MVLVLMKLQVALDSTLQDSLRILEQVHPYVDVVELGTPLIFREGMHAARQLHATYPDLPLLADLKIMDAGEEEAAIAFEAGCQFATILGVTQNATLEGAVRAARRYGGQLIVDMMQVPDLINRARDLLAMGCDVLCVHTAYDMQMERSVPFAALQTLRETFPKARLAVAGGIDLDSLETVLQWHPEFIVVGGGIVRAQDPAATAQRLQERIRAHE